MSNSFTLSRHISNILTLLRIALVPFFLCSVFARSALSGATALSLFLIACFTDYMDGYFARKRDRQSRFGEFVDPLADKILAGGAFIAFSLLPELNVPFPIVVVVLTREILVTLLRIVALRRGTVMKTEYAGKLKTVFQMFSIGVILVFHLMYKIALSRAGNLSHRDHQALWTYLLGRKIGRAVTYTPLILISLSAFIALYSMIGYIKKWRVLVGRKPQ